VPWPEIWTSFAAMAAVTERLRFTSAVALVPLRSPVWLAKQVGTVAILSNYRVSLAGGVGWMSEEFEAAGEDFKTRGRRMDEALEICHTIWRGGHVEYHGRHYEFEPFEMTPRPTGPIPIWVGGDSDVALRRAARWDGWSGSFYDLEEAAEKIRRLEELREEAGTADRPEFERSMLLKNVPTRDDVRRAEELGYTSLHVAPWWSDEITRFDSPGIEVLRDAMARFSDDVMQRVAA
jgi:probable F420-dependent oxidoreductase